LFFFEKNDRHCHRAGRRNRKYADAADNNFRSLHRCAFPVSTSSLRTLSIVGNPVVCNCSLAWLHGGAHGDVGGPRRRRRVAT